MFEQSFEEWWSTRKSMSRAVALSVWRDASVEAWMKIKSSPHWHDGGSCEIVPTCKSYRGARPSTASLEV